MADTAQDGVCRETASVASLGGTQTGHLMCDLPAGHTGRHYDEQDSIQWVRVNKARMASRDEQPG